MEGAEITRDLIERYVLGQLSAHEGLELEARASLDPSCRAEIDELQARLEEFVQLNAVAPPSGLKQRVLDAVQSLGREAAGRPPVLHPGSMAADFTAWIEQPHMVRPADAGDVFFIPFADNVDGLSAVVWLASGAPEETHAQCVEKFLILEGSCRIEFPDRVHVLDEGDVLSIPLHTPHTVKVTSALPCKILLQRIAA